jgi:hypothetical protein
MTNFEVEQEIGDSERRYDLARRRVSELELALRGAEEKLERTNNVGRSHDVLRHSISKTEADLQAAKRGLVEAQQRMEDAWAMRSTPQVAIDVEGETSRA